MNRTGVLFLFVTVFIANVSVAEAKSVCLGSMFWLTDNGSTFSGNNGEARTAFRFGIETVNRMGLLGNNRSFEAIEFNTTTALEAVDHTLLMTRASVRCTSGTRVMGVIGPAYSSHALISGQLASLARVPMISNSATSPVLADRRRYPYFVRTTPSDADSSVAITALVKELGWKSVCTIASAGDYGERGEAAFRDLATRTANITVSAVAVVDTESIFSGSEDFSYRRGVVASLADQLAPLALSSQCLVNVIFVSGNLPFLIAALAKSSRVGPRFVYILASIDQYGTSSEFFKSGVFEEGLASSAVLATGWLGVAPYIGDAGSLMFRNILDNLRAEKASQDVSLTNPYYEFDRSAEYSYYNVFAFDAVLAFAAAFSAVNDPEDGVAVMKTLTNLRGVAGAAGTISFSATGSRVGIAYRVVNLFLKPGEDRSSVVTIGRVESNQTFTWLPGYAKDGTGIAWPAGSGTKKPLDYVVVQKVTRMTFVGSVLLFSVLIIVIGLVVRINREVLARATWPPVRPAPVRLRPSNIVRAVFSLLFLAIEFFQLMSMAFPLGPQNQGGFAIINKVVTIFVFPPVHLRTAFWASMSICTIFLFISLPLATQVFNSVTKGAPLARFPRAKAFLTRWLAIASPLAYFFFPLSRVLYPLLVAQLLRAMACSDIIITPVVEGVVTEFSSVGDLVCGESEQILFAIVSFIIVILLSVSSITCEVFISVSSSYAFFAFSPSSQIKMSLIKLWSVAFRVGSQGYPIVGLITSSP